MNQKAYKKLNAIRAKDIERFKLDNIEFNSYKIERKTTYDEFASKFGDVIYEVLNDNRRSDIFKNYHDGIYWMIKHEKELYEELKRIASDVECLKDCAVAFMPNMQILSFTNRFDDGIYGIEIYYGLFMQANLLAQAVLMEDACPDEQGKNLYQWLVQNSFSMYEKQYVSKLHPHLLMNIKSSHIADLIVRFFALHELGHIALSRSQALAWECILWLLSYAFPMRTLGTREIIFDNYPHIVAVRTYHPNAQIKGGKKEFNKEIVNFIVYLVPKL